MKIKNYFLLFLITVTTITINAQNYLGANAQLILPQNEFKQKGYSVGGGIGFQYLSKDLIKHTPVFQTRMNYQMDILTSQSKRVRDVAAPFNNDRTDVYYSNTSVGFSVGPQFSVRLGKRWQPYATFFGTARVFNSHKSYHSDEFYFYGEDFYGPATEASKNLYSAVRLQYGYGGGIMYKVANKTHIDVRVSYAKGSGTTFVKLNSIRKTNDGNTEFSTEKSQTSDAINAYIGVIFSL